MIKTWRKFNESNSFELTNEMILDIIIFAQFSIQLSTEISKIINVIKNNDILMDLLEEWESTWFENEENFITNKLISDFNRHISEVMNQIKNDNDVKSQLKQIWMNIKKLLGKIPTFSEIIDMSVDILDSKYKLDFELRTVLEITYFKECNISEHISSYKDIETLMSRLGSKGINVYLYSFNYDWPETVNQDNLESRIKIRVSNRN
jgi:hypothetical protein